MKRIYEGIIGSFNNSPIGFSGRKLTAFWFMLLATYVHWKHLSGENETMFLLIDAGTALLCLGIITFEQVLKFKNGKDAGQTD